MVFVPNTNVVQSKHKEENQFNFKVSLKTKIQRNFTEKIDKDISLQRGQTKSMTKKTQKFSD